ncbi:MAG TPA: CpsD/CapB family tyrosine-protein kinase [Candidatus Deferrimicrobium sp.]|nr:CpsD/CapB family tyrosine-protein kinase [Candidatus Deferrimicrobium sp.]
MAAQGISIIDVFNPELPFVTEFRRLLHRLHNAGGTNELKAILFTSAMLAEGKSTVCSFLALTAARHKGIKTLMIDCDLRRPVLHRFLATRREPGLSDILTTGVSAETCIRKTEIPTLDFLPAGKPTPNPAEILNVDVIGHLIDEMKFYYDLIIIDTSPILPVSDPMLLAPKVDGVVLVIKAGATQREVVHRAVEIIDSTKSKIIGVVLNNMDNSLPYYYNYGYYGYDYSARDERPARQADKKSSGSRKSAVKPPDNVTPAESQTKRT